MNKVRAQKALSSDRSLRSFSRASNGQLASPVLHLQLLLGLAVVLGGGGVAYGIQNLIVQLTALAILAFHHRRAREFLTIAPRGLIWLLGATLTLPLAQIIPLPPALWQALPGREQIVESLGLIGAPADQWFPISVDRARSLVALCGTLAPLTVIVIGATFAPVERARLGWSMVVAALCVLLLGFAQISTGNSFAILYSDRGSADVLYGTFANRNSTGLLFVLALILSMSLPLTRPRKWLLPLIIAALLLGVGVVLTQSRSSMVLLVLALGFALLRFVLAWLAARRMGAGAHKIGLLALGGLAAMLLLAMAGFSFGSPGRASQSLERFSTIEADRAQMWEDGWFATSHYWPVGSGMGTFEEVFQLHESLEYVSPRMAGRMHSDILELALEAGLVGMILLAGWLAFLARASLFGGSEIGRWLRYGAGLGLACIGLQSIVDYPLRNQTLLCLAAVLVVLLIAPRRELT